MPDETNDRFLPVAGNGNGHPAVETKVEITPEKPKEPGPFRLFWAANGRKILLYTTVLTTILIGFQESLSFFTMQYTIPPVAGGELWQLFFYPPILFSTLAYTAALLGFLTAHEMGHYFMCRRYRIDATLPYYLPNPLMFGTFGAVIRIKSPITNKTALFDIGVAGPLSGFAVALPLLIIGISQSIVIPAGIHTGVDENFLVVLGEPMLQKAITALMFQGRGDIDIIMSPLAMVGWFGLLVTSINLLPVAQLDGGHILYAVFGRKHHFVSVGVIVMMLALAIFTSFYGWLFWALLIIFLMGLRHPPLADENRSLNPPRLFVAFLALLIFAVSFIPVPMQIT